MIRAFPTIPEFSRFCSNFPEGWKHRVWCEESIATIPKTIRVLPTFSEVFRRLKPSCLLSFLIFLDTRNRLRLLPKRYENSQT
ncbi:hypothetical protein NQ317_004241 [Molorchus minor]|uniref:Uncharacterized protein n=1 Tax=Molorchus minor TaxID=1323400 RepID=A0ABQ9K1Y4_9CUCU|nr:hypothetical protein NQ317_004241 [Molorchus minor]